MAEVKPPVPAAPKFEVPGDWKVRCDLIRLGAANRHEYMPLYPDFLKSLLSVTATDFSVFFAAGWDMYEVMRPAEFTLELVKEILNAHKKNPASTRICVRKTEYHRYERIVESYRRAKFETVSGGDSASHEAAYRIYSELSAVSQTVMRGNIDVEAYMRIARASSSTVMMMCSTRDVVRFLSDIVGKEPGLYDHGAVTAIVSAALSWNTLKLPKRESKLAVQSALLHDAERNCAYLGKPAQPQQISVNAIKDISALVADRKAFHEMNIHVMQQYREKFGGGGAPKNLRGAAEDVPNGILRIARIVAIGCAFSEYMLKRQDKLPLSLDTIFELMFERTTKGDFDPEIMKEFAADMRTGTVRRPAEGAPKDEFDDDDF